MLLESNYCPLEMKSFSLAVIKVIHAILRFRLGFSPQSLQ